MWIVKRPYSKGRAEPETAIPHMVYFDGLESKGEFYKNAMRKIFVASITFDCKTGHLVLKSLENRKLDKDNFLHILKTKFSCKLSPGEAESILSLFTKDDDAVDGCEFMVIFYRLRYEYRDFDLKERIARERKIKADRLKLDSSRGEAFERKLKPKVNISCHFSDADTKSALDKLSETALWFERYFLGSEQLKAFEVEVMSPEQLKQQLHTVFGIQSGALSSNEFAALVDYFSRDDGMIESASFLRQFFRLGYAERAKRADKLRHLGEKQKSSLIEEESKAADEVARKNASSCDFNFTTTDSERALAKLLQAANKHFDHTPGSLITKAFETSRMEPYDLRELVKRLLRLDLTPAEVGALVQRYDVDGSKTVSCSDFLQELSSMSLSLRQQEDREKRLAHKKAEEARREQEEVKLRASQEMETREFDTNYSEFDFQDAMKKLTDAAWRYDKFSSLAPNMSSFDVKALSPSEFKEQLRRTFGIVVTPKEMGALLFYFDADDAGNVLCKTFLARFIQLGLEERSERAQKWKQHEKMIIEKRMRRDATWTLGAEGKLHIDMPTEYSEEAFQSVMDKLGLAAMKFSKSNSVGLSGFDSVDITPFHFKQQLKMVFGVNVSVEELAALVDHFDTEGHGHVTCKFFLNEIFRLGLSERERLRSVWRQQRTAWKAQLAEVAKLKEQKEKESAFADVDFNFSEQDFDEALMRFVRFSIYFDYRILGPTGFDPFQSAALAPKEFRTLAHKVLGFKLNNQELGALITFWDPSTRGTVNCSHFISSFFHIRNNGDSIRSKPNEPQLLRDLCDKLKQQYRTRVQKQVDDVAGAQSIRNVAHKGRPWKIGFVSKLVDAATVKRSLQASGMLAVSRGSPACLSPTKKLQLRFKVARKLGVLDLSTSSGAMSVTTSDCIDGVEADRKPLRSRGEGATMYPLTVFEKLMDASSRREILFPRTMPETQRRLTSIPANVFKLSELKELWLCRNEINAVPEQIAALRQLTVLSLPNNRLTELPEEISSLQRLSRLMLQGNQLTSIPASFAKLALTELNLSRNHFTDVLPQLTGMSSLCFLDVSYNQIPFLPIYLRFMGLLTLLNIEGNYRVSPASDELDQEIIRKLKARAVCVIVEDSAPLKRMPTYPFKELITSHPESEESITAFIRARALVRRTTKTRGATRKL